MSKLDKGFTREAPFAVYDYRVFPAEDVRSYFRQQTAVDEPFAGGTARYQIAVTLLQAALRQGFRWVRTDGEWAVFERQV